MEKYFRFILAVSFPLSVLFAVTSLLEPNYLGSIFMLLGAFLIARGWKGRLDGVPYWKKWSFYFSQIIFLGTIISISFFLVMPLF